MKRIKESITEQEHKQILTYLNGKQTLSLNTKQNIKTTLILLYYTGMRINELQQLTIKDLKKLIIEKELIIETFKTKKERKLYISNNAVKELKKLFDYKKEDDNNLIIRSKGNPNKTINNLTFINTINKFIQEALNSNRYTSHSYRQNLITQMSKSINTKFIQQFIGHSDIKTTMRYIKPTNEELRECVVI